MGFRLDRTYVLQFEGAMAGAEVKIRSTSIATMMRIRQVQELSELAGLLADHLVEWNLEDEKGEPLPTTADAIMSNLEGVVLGRIAREWYRAASGVTAPLDPSPPPTGLFDEESMQVQE